MIFGLAGSAQVEAARIAAAQGRLQRRLEDDPSVTTMQPGGVTTIPPPAFVNGPGGERLTPELLKARREVAQQQMAAGMDFSPVQHWSQGLARVAQALVGNLENSRLDKLDARNAAENQTVAQLLINNPTMATAAAASTNPYVSADTRKLGLSQVERLTPKPQQPSDLQQRVEYLDGFQPGLGGQYAQNYAANGGGAPQFVTTPQGTFMIPRGAGPAPAAPAPAPIPDAAVSFLRTNPASAAQFDAKYGAGSSARYLQGGAAPQASAPFPTR